MSPTLDFELACVGAGIVLAVVAASLHSMDVGLAGAGLAVLAAYAAWLDRRR
jgi:hypothetical protein